MTRFNLAFRAYDVHELGCHLVARYAGLYERHGLQPSLIDATFLTDEELPPRTFYAACAAVLADWLLDAPARVVFVAAERPMFWLYGAPGVGELGDLRGRVVAGYPALTPPAAFLCETWAHCGYPAEQLQIVASRDDAARIGLLREGAAMGAMISSAVSPDTLAALGFEPVLFFGDKIRLATTGLAARRSFCRAEPELVAQLCGCYKEAIGLIQGDTKLLQNVLADMPAIGDSGAATMAAYLQRCYTADGRSAPDHLASGVELMARALDVEPRPAQDFYDFSFLA